jgi:hypothetical protein
MNWKTLLISTCIALVTVSCGSTTTRQPEPRAIDEALKQVTGKNGRECVYVRDIQGFGALSDSVLSVSGKFKKHYLMVTLYRCPSIQYGGGAAFWGSYSEFCGGGRDSVQSQDKPCPVKSVFEFDSRDDAFAAHDKALEIIYGPEEDAAGKEKSD